MFSMSMLKINQAILVEGKYDKIKLSSFIDGVILTTEGFQIFKNKEKCAMIKTLADTTGLLVITDSDVAGFKIRNFIKSITQNSPNVMNLYIPQIKGKEKRKHMASKEGYLGVEGFDIQLLKELFEQHQVNYQSQEKVTRKITKLDLYEYGFSGTDNSGQKRARLLSVLKLPSHLSANALIPVLNALMSYEEFQKLAQTIE